MEVIIKDIIGTSCITAEDGDKIYQIIYKQLKKGDEIILNFKDVKHFSAVFFNAAIGKLLKDFTNLQLKQLLHIKNVTNETKSLIELIIKNSTKYYDNPNYQKIVDDVIRHVMEY